MVGESGVSESKADTDRQPRRRWFARFSLRTAFVLVTLVCVWLGVQVNRAKNERAAKFAFQQVEALHFNDAQVDSSDFSIIPIGEARAAEAKWKRHLRQWLGDDYVDRIASVAFMGKPIDLEHLRIAGKLSHLRELSIQDQTQLGDEVIAEVKHLKLKTLCLWRTQVTDVGLRDLANSPISQTLTGLGLSGTRVTDAGLEHVAKLKGLTILELEDTKVSDAAVTKLSKQLPECGISTSSGFWNDGARH